MSLEVSELLEPAPDAPPLAGLFDVSLEELELEGDDALPEGELGDVLVPPEDEDIEPDGEVVDPEGDVLRSLERLQPVTTAVPSARVTASAKVESLMRPPW